MDKLSFLLMLCLRSSKPKKSPKLVHSISPPAAVTSGPKLRIYTQSATEEEGTDAEEHQRRAIALTESTKNLLQVPKRRDVQQQQQQQASFLF